MFPTSEYYPSAGFQSSNMWRPEVSSSGIGLQSPNMRKAEFSSGAGFQSPHMWRPEVSSPFSVSLPLFQRSTQSQFMPSGHGSSIGYGGGYPGQPQFSSFVGSSSGMPQLPVPSNGLASPSALIAYTQGTGNVSSDYSPSASPNWFLDSGATNHVTSDLSNITHPQPYSAGGGVMVGNGNSLLVSCSGNGILPTPKVKFHLTNILHTPAITHNSPLCFSIC